MPVINTKRDIDKDQTRPAREPGGGRAVLAYSGGVEGQCGKEEGKKRQPPQRCCSLRNMGCETALSARIDSWSLGGLCAKYLVPNPRASTFSCLKACRWPCLLLGSPAVCQAIQGRHAGPFTEAVERFPSNSRASTTPGRYQLQTAGYHKKGASVRPRMACPMAARSCDDVMNDTGTMFPKSRQRGEDSHRPRMSRMSFSAGLSVG